MDGRLKSMPLAYAFFSLKTQFENVGDALINRELIRLAAKYTMVHVDVSRCPEDFRNSLNLKKYAPTVEVLSTVRLFRRMIYARLHRKSVYYFLSPGGYVGTKPALSLLQATVNTIVLLLLRIMGVRICHVGVSFERLCPRHARLLNVRSRFMHRVLARDPHSAEYASSLGIRVDGTMPDLAFGAAEYRERRPPGNTVAVSFRVDQAAHQASKVVELVKRLDDAISEDIAFKFVAQVARDEQFMKKLSEATYKSGRRVELVTTFDDVDRAFEAFDGCRAVFSNRLHALLMGVMNGVVPVAVVDSDVNEKVLNLFNTFGWKTYSWGDALPDLDWDHLVSRQLACISDKQYHDLNLAFKNLFLRDIEGNQC